MIAARFGKLGWASVLLVALVGVVLAPLGGSEAQAQESTVVPVTFPAGDPMEGKLVFAERLCTACHRVSDDPDFRTAGELMDGPDLALSSKKSIGFLATAIIAPSHQIPAERATQEQPEDLVDFADSEGYSLMPSVNESLTVAELVDLLAYLSSTAEQR